MYVGGKPFQAADGHRLPFNPPDVYKRQGEKYDLVIAIGPLPMMRAVADVTKKYGVKTVVSMNPVSYTHL